MSNPQSEIRNPQSVDFVRDIQPILRTSCFKCHGPEKPKGHLRLDSRALAMKGGTSGRVIVPGNAKDSLLHKLLLEKDDAERMPQKAAALSPGQIELVRAWIDQGAVWPDAAAGDGVAEVHWAYAKPVRREPPGVVNAAWVRNPIDAFIGAAHEKNGLRPRPEAPRPVLLRRLYLDLIGVPPTREELHAFVAEGSPDAYEKVVDRLLADPRHGERWGRHWMDVWRYSDWAGYGAEVRYSQKHIWRWRDWIVESLNADKGYDRMVVEMLAGDEVAPEDPEALRATGFLVRNWFRFNRNVWLDSTIEHTAKAFLGTTLNCARCHSHKFDPISQNDYYRFRAFFEPHEVRTDRVPGQPDLEKDGIPRSYDATLDAATYLFVRGDEQKPDKSKPLAPGLPVAWGSIPVSIQPVPVPPAATAPDRREFVVRDLLAAEEQAVVQARKAVEAAMEKLARAEQAAATDAKGQPAVQTALEELPLAVMAVPIAEAKRAAFAGVIETERLKQDSEEWKKAATEAGRAQRALAVLEARKNVFTAQRAAARGKGGDAKSKLAEAEKALAKAEKDGASPPSTAFTPRKVTQYPATSTGRRLALARWIASAENPLTARVAINHLWLRHFGKGLVPTVFEFGHNGQPPTHPELLDWLACELVAQGWSLKKMHRLMVTSSAYRMDSGSDAASYARDMDNRLLWRMNSRRMEAELVRDAVLHAAGQLDFTRGGPDLDQNLGLTVPRRSLYFRHAAEKQVEFLAIFDAASTNECYERTESIIPQQALALANSSLVLEKSKSLSERLSTEAPEPAAFVTAAFEQILTRAPTEDERNECVQFLATAGTRSRVILVHVLFNHHEFVTMR